MDNQLRACVTAYMHKHPGRVIDTLMEATNIGTFKQWLRDEAEQCRVRQLARAVDESGIPLSPDSMATLHQFDPPDDGE